MKDTLENNRLIALFMGWTVDYIVRPSTAEGSDKTIKEFVCSDGLGTVVQRTPETFFGTKELTEQKMWDDLLNPYYGRAGKYHLSWDELMPVVNKCLMNDRRQAEELEINKISIHDSKDIMYNSVVEFIKNLNKKVK